MDTITQAVLGAAVAEAGWRQQHGRKAIYVGVFCGLLPDFDILAALTGPWGDMIYHRGPTHSLFFAPVVAPLVGWLAWKWTKERGALWSWVHLAFWALITHPMLDMFTTYGTQLFYPFSNKRVAFDGVAIVDPMYTVPLMFALSLAWFYKQRPELGRRAARAMLLLTSCYLLLGTFQSQQARKLAQAQLTKERFRPLEVRALPTLLNIFLWRIVARNAQGDIGVGMHSSIKPTHIPFHIHRRERDPLIQKALAHDRMKLLLWFASDMLTLRLEKKSTGAILYLDDQRFALVQDPTRTFMGARAYFDKDGQLQRFVRFRSPPTNISLRLEFASMWQMLWNGTEKK